MSNLRKVLALLLVMVMVFTVTACSSEDESADADNDNDTTVDSVEDDEEESSDLSGTVAISGSTSVEKIGTAIADEFMAQNPGVTVTYQGVGSSQGVSDADDRTANIGTASRDLKDSEEELGMEVVTIAHDGIATITHPDNPVESLTMEEIKGIFTGEITNWSEVGGNDEEIVVYSREAGSGTRGAFEEIVDFEDELVASALTAEGNGNVQVSVAGNPQAIGYVSFEYINETIKPLSVDGVEASVENVLAGDYPVSRPFLMVYHEDNMDDAALAYIEFVLGEGQDIVEENGGIRVD